MRHAIQIEPDNATPDVRAENEANSERWETSGKCVDKLKAIAGPAYKEIVAPLVVAHFKQRIGLPPG